MFDRGMTLWLYTTPKYKREKRWSSGGHDFGDVCEVTITCIEDRRDRDSVLRPLPPGSRLHAPTAAAPAARLVVRRLGGVDLWSVEPHEDRKGWYMAGGAYAACCDSRFSEIVGHGVGAVAVHDRWEGQ